MNLPPQAINALVRLRAEMALREAEKSVMITLRSEPKHKRVMKHAKRPNSFQRMCQHRDWASPIY